MISGLRHMNIRITILIMDMAGRLEFIGAGRVITAAGTEAGAAGMAVIVAGTAAVDSTADLEAADFTGVAAGTIKLDY